MGEPGHFTRTANRHDYAVPPPKGMLLDQLGERRVEVHSVGKIFDVFLGRGIRRIREDQEQCRRHGQDAGSHGRAERGLIFVNLVDFDQQYGHRNDVEGYARALEEFDAWLPSLEATGRGRPGDFYGRSRLRPDHAVHRPQPRVCAAAGLRQEGARRRGSGVRARRYRISARRSRRISARGIVHGESFLPLISR